MPLPLTGSGRRKRSGGPPGEGWLRYSAPLSWPRINSYVLPVYSDQELQDGFASMDAEAQDVINGYVAGFNRRIAEIRKNPSLLPFEFSAVGITSTTLEDWTYKDVLAWASLMLRNFDPEAQKQGQIDNAALYQGLVAAYGADARTAYVRGFTMGQRSRRADLYSQTYQSFPAIGLQESRERYASPLMENPPSFPDMREVAKSMAETRSRDRRKSEEDKRLCKDGQLCLGDKREQNVLR